MNGRNNRFSIIALLYVGTKVIKVYNSMGFPVSSGPFSLTRYGLILSWIRSPNLNSYYWTDDGKNLLKFEIFVVFSREKKNANVLGQNKFLGLALAAVVS